MSRPLKSPIIIPIDQLIETPYSSVLCFPKPSIAELESRIDELRSHSVAYLEFSGHSSVFGVPLPVLGKGFVGIVVIAHLSSLERVAIKIRRLDADRVDLLHEAKMLSKANLAGVAPKYVGVSKNFLLMQLIEGDLLPAWLESNNEHTLVKEVLGEVLLSCYRLDEIGLDHGELSKAPKHVIIDRQNKPWLVDFETSSDCRKVANLPAMCHFLFSSAGEVARTVTEKLGKRDREEIISSLQAYKKCRTRESFEKVIQICLG
jgi:putative serine/threonine protein kinase